MLVLPLLAGAGVILEIEFRVKRRPPASGYGWTCRISQG
jgi:hypothetical protein